VNAIWRWYRSLRGWLQWTIGLGVLLLVLVAMPGNDQQSVQERAARAEPSRTPGDFHPSTPVSTPTRTATPTPRATRTAPRRPKPANETALAALDTLPVKGRAPKTGYGREQFGGDWASSNGCDTRQRILKRDLRRERYQAGSTCEIVLGRLADPYTATLIAYVRGGASEVDIDHVVALSDAWQKGAQQWPYARRVKFANDPLNLLAVDASANRQKGDGDAATWLPANKSFRCTYVARQIAVKQRYRAWVTQAEHDAMQRVLTPCPDTPLPKRGRVLVPVAAGAPEPTPTPAAPPAERPSSDGEVFASCGAVLAAGRAPLLRGDPAYAANPQLDRDKDGVACETTAPPAAPTSSDGDAFASCGAVRAAGRAPLLRGDPAYAANPQLDRDKDGVACEP
jgi:Protein of unknown function (DUF1524)/Excalibur calcium-binding domain